MRFGLFFFGNARSDSAAFYDFILRLARFADESGLSFISFPERHFHRFGGAFPNPLPLLAAAAAVTKRIQLRTGSLVLPLHDPVRVAEDLAMVDNLSRGRVAVSLGTGWNPTDFVLAPDDYASRREVMRTGLAALRDLWAGESTERVNGAGMKVALRTYPRPVQSALPLWLTISGNPQSYELAAREGLNVLTHLETQSPSVLAQRVAGYRDAAAQMPGFGRGTVTVMQHTLIEERDDVRKHAQQSLREYLAASADLERAAVAGGGAMSGGRKDGDAQAAILDAQNRDAMIDFGVRRYLDGPSLIGSEDDCRRQVDTLSASGVDEVACLVDFVEEEELVWETVRRIDSLAREYRTPEVSA